MRLKVSRKFYEALKTSNRPNYSISWEASVHPVLLSKLIHGCERVRPNDHRVLAVGKVLGLQPEECFEEIIEEQRL